MSRLVRLAGGSTLIVAGVAMLVLPGPGLLTIAAGVALMADAEVAWARHVTEWGREKVAERRARAAHRVGPGQDGG